MAQNLELRQSKEKTYKTLSIILGIALVLSLLGWVSASKNIDPNSLAERLKACEGLAFANEDEECAGAIAELESLLRDYQGTLQGIETRDPSDIGTSTATTTTGRIQLNPSAN
jgi:hypothetical protein